MGVKNIVAYLLKARIMDLEKHPLLTNGSETTFVSRRQLGKHVPGATDNHTTTEVLLETVFSIRPIQRGYREKNWGIRVSSVRECVKKRCSWQRTNHCQ
jgi:hypothetical protein